MKSADKQKMKRAFDTKILAVRMVRTIVIFFIPGLALNKSFNQ
jgi:hypothetical protein